MLLSTAMPTVRANPAKPVKVKRVEGTHHGEQDQHVSINAMLAPSGEVIVEEHEQRHEDAGDDHRPRACIDRVLPSVGPCTAC